MITLLIAALIFASFTVYVIKKYKVLESFSAYYYKVHPALFFAVLASVGILMGVSGNGWTMAAGGFLTGVGVAAHYRWAAEQSIHIFCAVAAILLGFVSISLMGGWPITVLFIPIAVILLYSRHYSTTLLIELWAFMCIFAGLLIEKL